MKKRIALFVVLIIVASCSVKPKEIFYGEDMCHFCSMTIVDRQYAAQLVTSKGKVYKFDAAECMINHLAKDDTPMAHYLVTNYMIPEKLIDARQATFLISPNIPSPMRENLTSLRSVEEAQILQKEKEGDIYSWKELLMRLDKE